MISKIHLNVNMFHFYAQNCGEELIVNAAKVYMYS
jgi:hypothetical protein